MFSALIAKFRWLFWTEPGFDPVLLRLALGAVMFPHGAQKLLGWFGGAGYSATIQGFGQTGIPGVLAFLVVVIEFFGSLSLIVGWKVRAMGFLFAVIMTVAMLKVHWANGFFMNWLGNQAGEGFEYHLLAVGIGLALTVRGAGSLSLDRLVAKE